MKSFISSVPCTRVLIECTISHRPSNCIPSPLVSRCFSRTIVTRPYEHFYRYTSGRWLWDEEKKLRERYKQFNVPELKKIAARSVGANNCVHITKLAEGGSNKVFRLVMDNGVAVVARLPFPRDGPSFKVTASEVATMDFVS